MPYELTPDFAKSVGLPEERFPETLEEADVVDEILSNELAKLSVQEHETILFDIHGISPVVEEDAQMVETKLREMETLLETLPENDAYMEAKKISEAYVAEQRLVYLRGEHYDAQAAAEKLAFRFGIKKELFGGGSILARDIRWSDLTEIAQKVLDSGYLVASTVRDSSGRAVMFGTSQYCNDTAVRDMEKAIFYYTSLTLRDEETLKGGLVWVFYNLDGLVLPQDFMLRLFRIQKTIPPQHVAIHYVFSDDNVRPFLKGLQLICSDKERFRFKEHHGSLDEIEFSLQTFGIPTEVSPQRKDGTWNQTWSQAWLEAQRKKEEQVAATWNSRNNALLNDHDASAVVSDDENSAIVIPGRFDVILGKSPEAIVHTGNRRALHLCQMHFEQYDKAYKYEKTEISERIVSIIRESGGRFIKWEDSEGWIEESDEAVLRKKIAHSLRYLRSRARQQSSKSAAAENVEGTASAKVEETRKRSINSDGRP